MERKIQWQLKTKKVILLNVQNENIFSENVSVIHRDGTIQYSLQFRPKIGKLLWMCVVNAEILRSIALNSTCKRSSCSLLSCHSNAFAGSWTSN